MTIKEKKLLIILILCTLTAISMQWLFSFYKQTVFEENIERWIFTPSSNEVTPKDFAKMYVDGNIEESIYFSNESNNIELTTINTQINEILNNITKDKTTLEYFKEMFKWPIIYHESKSFIKLVNHQPVAFDIVLITYGNSNGEFLEIVYEQRTLALLQMVIQTEFEKYNSPLLSEEISKYFENILGLTSKNYYVNRVYINDDYRILINNSFIIHPSNKEEYVN